MKEPILAPYCTVAQKVMDGFEEITIEYVPRIKNCQPNALATIASRVHMTKETLKMGVIKTTLPSTVLELFPKEAVDDWRHPIVCQLKTKDDTLSLSEFQKYAIIKGILYHRKSDRVLARCLRKEEAKVKLEQIHIEN